MDRPVDYPPRQSFYFDDRESKRRPPPSEPRDNERGPPPPAGPFADRPPPSREYRGPPVSGSERPPQDLDGRISDNRPPRGRYFLIKTPTIQTILKSRQTVWDVVSRLTIGTLGLRSQRC
jgi:hypothetical protein